MSNVRFELVFVCFFTSGQRDEPSSPGQLSLLYLLMVAMGIIILILILGVVAAKHKRKLGPLWFPEGFTLKKVGNRKRREPVGQDAVGMKYVSLLLLVVLSVRLCKCCIDGFH